MKTFDEILKERQSSYQDINNEISKAEYNDIDLKKKVAELVESKMTDPPILKPVFKQISLFANLCFSVLNLFFIGFFFF